MAVAEALHPDRPAAELSELWQCRGEVRPLGRADLADATFVAVVAFVHAASREECDRAFADALAGSDLELVELYGAEPLDEAWGVESDRVEAALEAAATGEPVLVLQTTDEPEDAEDDDTAAVREAAATGDVIQFRLIARDDSHVARVAAVTDRWALVRLIEVGMVAFDAYAAVLLDEVIDVETLDGDMFVYRLLGQPPPVPEVPLDDHRSILAALQGRVVALADTTVAGALAFGRVEAADEDAVTLRGVDAYARWTSEHRHRYADVAAVFFGGAYQEALAARAASGSGR